MDHQQALRRIVAFFESIRPEDANRMDELYATDAWFKDPFNEVRGIDEVMRIFVHMFTQVDGPRFVVTDSVLQGDQAFLTWNFLFRMKRFSRDEQCIRGASHVRFAPDGRVMFHRDYWDAAEELYEKLPVLGGLMRVLKRAARN
jgi:ketosteroid isomerase-like protein